MGCPAPPMPVLSVRSPVLPVWKRSHEEQQRLHAEAEARREVESWFTGERYRWRPWSRDYFRPPERRR